MFISSKPAKHFLLHLTMPLSTYSTFVHWGMLQLQLYLLHLFTIYSRCTSSSREARPKHACKARLLGSYIPVQGLALLCAGQA